MTNVLVIGAGISGLAAAHALNGADVTVVEVVALVAFCVFIGLLFFKQPSK